MAEKMIESDWSESERREYERYSVMFYLAVYDRENDSSLGQILDISMGGLRLLSEKSIPVNACFHLVIDVSLESGKKGKIAVEAKSVWGQEDDNPGFYVTGFQFFGLSPQAKRFIRTIVDELSG